KAGIHKDDIILKVNGTDVKGFDDLEKAFKDAHAGDKVRLTVKRGDETKEIEIELGVPRLPRCSPRSAPRWPPRAKRRAVSRSTSAWRSSRSRRPRRGQ